MVATPMSGSGTGPTYRRSSRFRRRLRWLLISGAAVVAVLAAITAWLLVWPPQGMPTRVDAIVLLAGPGNRMPVALELADEHRAPVLVVSQGHLGYGGPCPVPIRGVRIICFDPNPSDTRGEAEYVSRLAKRYGWRSMVLVATRPQATRARLLMNRCYSGSVYVVTAAFPWEDWPYQIAYGWGSLIKALVWQRAC